MVGKTISHYKILEKLGEGGTWPVGQYSFIKESLLMLGKTIHHYEILEELGRGGMGVVYKAEDTKLQRTVALKFLPLEVAGDDELRQRFINEARTASALNHPNICTIHAVDDGDQPFIAMELVAGRELREIVGAQHAVPLRDVIDYANQIAEGLQAAHEKGITDRDMKSANIMVTRTCS